MFRWRCNYIYHIEWQYRMFPSYDLNVCGRNWSWRYDGNVTSNTSHIRVSNWRTNWKRTPREMLKEFPEMLTVQLSCASSCHHTRTLRTPTGSIRDHQSIILIVIFGSPVKSDYHLIRTLFHVFVYVDDISIFLCGIYKAISPCFQLDTSACCKGWSLNGRSNVIVNTI
jgi:hypothetical protein